MDLTRVALPTFILERRSLLEMYADYFAHPDLFVRIADLEGKVFTSSSSSSLFRICHFVLDPRDRMVQVVRWYLSSFHAGRKSSVAKKPYNPVLGEVFKCHWDVPGYTEVKSKDLAEDGPIPWCAKDNLTFIAEQVTLKILLTGINFLNTFLVRYHIIHQYQHFMPNMSQKEYHLMPMFIQKVNFWDLVYV